MTEEQTAEKIEGQWDQAKGAVKEGVGDAIDDEKMQREGQWDQAKGNVKEGVGNAKEGVDDAVDDRRRARRAEIPQAVAGDRVQEVDVVVVPAGAHAGGFLWFLILVAITMSDYASRDWLPVFGK